MSRRTRVIAAAVMAPVAILAVLCLPSAVLAVVVAGVLMLGLREWTLLAGVRDRLWQALYLIANALVMAAVAWSGMPTLHLVSLFGACWWLLVLVWLTQFKFAAVESGWSRALKLLAGSLCVIPAWTAVYWLHATQPNGPAWALFALLIVWAADSAAYFVGVRFGKHKLAPTISPGKSWEGFAGGLLGTLLLAVLVFSFLGLSWPSVPGLLLLTLVAALFSVAGDLFESLLKRHAGSKDSSDLIPGHGGVLDRVDSLLAALPIFVVGKQWLGL